MATPLTSERVHEQPVVRPPEHETHWKRSAGVAVGGFLAARLLRIGLLSRVLRLLLWTARHPSGRALLVLAFKRARTRKR